MRLDTRGDFKDPSSYRTFDARSQDPRAVCFDGAAFDGRYVYFVPLQTNTVLRCNTRGDFTDPAAWQTHDATTSWTAANADYTDSLHTSAYTTGATDGRYLYGAP